MIIIITAVLIIVAVAAWHIKNAGWEELQVGLGFMVFFMVVLTFTSLAWGTDQGREMELCDQAGGVYSLWSDQCMTPTTVIELGTE